jgi:hypothetical protein
LNQSDLPKRGGILTPSTGLGEFLVLKKIKKKARFARLKRKKVTG